MDAPTQMAYRSLMREVHLLGDKFEQLRPYIHGALQFPREQVFSVWRALTALALPVHAAQSQLLAEAVTRDGATLGALDALHATGFVPELGRVHTADMAEAVLMENLVVIFVLNGQLPEETDADDAGARYAPQMCETLRSAHPAALIAWALYFHASSWTRMSNRLFTAFFSSIKDSIACDSLPDEVYASLSRLGAKYPLQGNLTFMNWLQMVGRRRDGVQS